LRADREYWVSLWAPACAIARSASPRSQLAGRDCPPGRGAAYARSAAVACDGRERYSALTGESMMGIFSWLSRWREDPSAGRQTLIFRNDEDDPEFDEIRRAAAADVAAVEQDDKFFGRNPPADQDEGL
jgi:hypothetical protein